MTAANMAALVGLQAELATDGLLIQVEILDVRKVWDRIDYLVRPLAGSGQSWVSAARVSGLAPRE